FATPLSIPSRWAFVRIKYARTPNTTPPTIAVIIATVRARPVAVSGLSRGARRARSRGCRLTVLPTSRAVAMVVCGAGAVTRGYRQVTNPTIRATVKTSMRRRRSGIALGPPAIHVTDGHVSLSGSETFDTSRQWKVSHDRAEDTSTGDRPLGRARYRRDVGGPAARSRPVGMQGRPGRKAGRRPTKPSPRACLRRPDARRAGRDSAAVD